MYRLGRGQYWYEQQPPLGSSGFPTHRECVNFRDGFCTLSGIAVNPEGIACPNFTPKSIMGMPQIARAYPGVQKPRWQPPTLPPSQPTGYPAQPFYYQPSYIPYPWGMYNYPAYPTFPTYPAYFMHPWSPYGRSGYWMTPWFGVPSPYLAYEYPAYGYGYQPHYPFPYPSTVPPQSPDEELRMLEARKGELQAEIESLDARIRELRGQVGRGPY